jgi:hypothetical protein
MPRMQRRLCMARRGASLLEEGRGVAMQSDTRTYSRATPPHTNRLIRPGLSVHELGAALLLGPLPTAYRHRRLFPSWIMKPPRWPLFHRDPQPSRPFGRRRRGKRLSHPPPAPPLSLSPLSRRLPRSPPSVPPRPPPPHTHTHIFSRRSRDLCRRELALLDVHDPPRPPRCRPDVLNQGAAQASALSSSAVALLCERRAGGAVCVHPKL